MVRMSDETFVWPTLRADDAPALIRWLVEVFGFEERLVVADGDRVAHAELRWPLGGGVMLGSVRDEPGDVWALRPGSFGCYVVTDDADALYRRVLEAGAVVDRELSDAGHGKEFVVRDPEGNRWSFGTYSGAAQ